MGDSNEGISSGSRLEGSTVRRRRVPPSSDKPTVNDGTTRGITTDTARKAAAFIDSEIAATSTGPVYALDFKRPVPTRLGGAGIPLADGRYVHHFSPTELIVDDPRAAKNSGCTFIPTGGRGKVPILTYPSRSKANPQSAQIPQLTSASQPILDFTVSPREVLSTAMEEEHLHAFRFTDEPEVAAESWRTSVHARLAQALQLFPDTNTVDPSQVPQFILQKDQQRRWLESVLPKDRDESFDQAEFIRGEVEIALVDMAVADQANQRSRGEYLRQLSTMLGCNSDLIAVQKALLKLFGFKELAEFKDLPKDWYQPADTGAEELDCSQPLDLERILSAGPVLPKFLKTKVSDVSEMEFRGVELDYGLGV